MKFSGFTGREGERSEHHGQTGTEQPSSASRDRVIPITQEQHDALSQQIFMEAMGVVLIFPTDEAA